MRDAREVRKGPEEGRDEACITKAGVFEFYWERLSIVVWEVRPIDLVPAK